MSLARCPCGQRSPGCRKNPPACQDHQGRRSGRPSQRVSRLQSWQAQRAARWPLVSAIVKAHPDAVGAPKTDFNQHPFAGATPLPVMPSGRHRHRRESDSPRLAAAAIAPARCARTAVPDLDARGDSVCPSLGSPFPTVLCLSLELQPESLRVLVARRGAGRLFRRGGRSWCLCSRYQLLVPEFAPVINNLRLSGGLDRARSSMRSVQAWSARARGMGMGSTSTSKLGISCCMRGG